MDNLWYRSFEFKRDWLNEDKREATISFSSETLEVKRWWGLEVLDHSPGAVDLSRLKRIGSHLFNHNPNQIIGPVRKPKIEDGRGMAVVGYDETDEGNRALIRTKSGSLRGVSVGYRVKEFTELAPGEEHQLATKIIKGREDTLIRIATKWEPIEISSTPVPWDTSVGLGRAATRSLDGIEIVRSNHQDQNQSHQGEDFELNEKELRQIIRDEIQNQGRGAGDRQIDRQHILTGEGTFSAEEVQLLDRAAAVGQEVKCGVMDLILGGRPQEVALFINDAVWGSSDARDSGGDGADGTARVGIKNNKQLQSSAPARSFDRIKDDEFFAAFRTTGSPIFR